MLLSRFFCPIQYSSSAGGSVSQSLMQRSGLICSTGNGLYSWLPLGVAVLRNIENTIRAEHEKIGALEITVPFVQVASLWDESGRYHSYGEEMLRFKDRHGNGLLYAPTNEEQVTDILRKLVHSYRDLPLLVYCIGHKFRDEIRPCGVKRSREFLMKDCYSADLDVESSLQVYHKMFVCYLRIFKKCGLRVVPMPADSGEIGGNLSHEFFALSKVGESNLVVSDSLLKAVDATGCDFSEIYKLSRIEGDNESDSAKKISVTGCEVGHIFNFGTKYSEILKFKVAGASDHIFPQMGSYGIGICRMVAAIIDANHDKHGIVWPNQISPFLCGVIPLCFSEECMSLSLEISALLEKKGYRTLIDDTDNSPGTKFVNMDVMGIPWHIIIGKRELAEQIVTIKDRRTGVKTAVPADQCCEFISSKLNDASC